MLAVVVLSKLQVSFGFSCPPMLPVLQMPKSFILAQKYFTITVSVLVSEMRTYSRQKEADGAKRHQEKLKMLFWFCFVL